MQKILETLAELSRTPLKVYLSEGEYDDLSVQLKEGLDEKQAQELSGRLPGEYLDLLRFSNGLNFYHSGDHSIFSYKEVMETRQVFELRDNTYPIAYF